MKSILTLFATFTLSLFFEFFIRIVIVFYHQTEWIFSGLSSIPGTNWIVIFCAGLFVSSWISGMLTVTIINFSPLKHLLLLYFIIIFWRISEYFGMNEPSISYTFSITLLQGTALLLAYYTKIKSNVQASNT
jgi:hypothetical protein